MLLTPISFSSPLFPPVTKQVGGREGRKKQAHEPLPSFLSLFPLTQIGSTNAWNWSSNEVVCSSFVSAPNVRRRREKDEKSEKAFFSLFSLILLAQLWNENQETRFVGASSTSRHGSTAKNGCFDFELISANDPGRRDEDANKARLILSFLLSFQSKRWGDLRTHFRNDHACGCRCFFCNQLVQNPHLWIPPLINPNEFNAYPAN